MLFGSTATARRPARCCDHLIRSCIVSDESNLAAIVHTCRRSTRPTGPVDHTDISDRRHAHLRATSARVSSCGQVSTGCEHRQVRSGSWTNQLDKSASGPCFKGFKAAACDCRPVCALAAKSRCAQTATADARATTRKGAQAAISVWSSAYSGYVTDINLAPW